MQVVPGVPSVFEDISAMRQELLDHMADILFWRKSQMQTIRTRTPDERTLDNFGFPSLDDIHFYVRLARVIKKELGGFDYNVMTPIVRTMAIEKLYMATESEHIL